MDQPSRYHRQTLLPQVGKAGQARLGAAHVVLVGCGALGSVIAEQLVRAGVGSIRIIDRDVVEWSNLQRQVLYDEDDAREQVPKAVAAQRRLSRVNSTVSIDPAVVDFHSGNAEVLAGLDGSGRRADLVLDGTDNVETRYLINDLCVKHGVPWVYGACVGTEGRVMTLRPPETACLRCVFGQPPAAGELPTCDTAGVLGPVAAVVAGLQAVAAIKLLVGGSVGATDGLTTMDLWAGRMRAVSVEGAKRPECPTCGGRVFDYLDQSAGERSVSLCGRNAVQVRPSNGNRLNLDELAERLRPVGAVERTPYLLRYPLDPQGVLRLTVFPDGRAIVHGTNDLHRARSLYARYVGS